MANPVIVDLRNVYPPEEAVRHGFTYAGLWKRIRRSLFLRSPAGMSGYNGVDDQFDSPLPIDDALPASGRGACARATLRCWSRRPAPARRRGCRWC